MKREGEEEAGAIVGVATAAEVFEALTVRDQGQNQFLSLIQAAGGSQNQNQNLDHYQNQRIQEASPLVQDQYQGVEAEAGAKLVIN